MKGYDLGVKRDVVESTVGLEEPEEKKVYYPRLYVENVELPEMPDGDFWMKVKACKVSSTKNHKRGTSSCELEIKELVPIGGGEKKEQTIEQIFEIALGIED
jgi:hypothetical protein